MTFVIRLRFHAAAVLLACAIAACSNDGARQASGTAAATKNPAHKVAATSAGDISLSSAPYQPGDLGATGGIVGTVAITNPDTGAAVAPGDCIGSGDISPHDSTDNGDVVVWIADVRSGKRFPVERRSDLTSVNCELEPRVQAMSAGTTVNVFNDDRALHRLVFTRAGTVDTLFVVPFTNAGETVPTEKIAKTPGLVEIRCTLHPWTRGYVAVFDTPYFAVANRAGHFAIDSVPPGRYTVMVWVPGTTEPRRQMVQVAAGQTAKVDIR